MTDIVIPITASRLRMGFTLLYVIAASVGMASAEGTTQSPAANDPKIDSKISPDIRPPLWQERTAVSKAFSELLLSCTTWDVPEGMPTVRLRLKFNRNGGLAAPPVVVDPKETPEFRALAQKAVRVIVRCAPFRLPEGQYEIWKDMVVQFVTGPKL